MLVFDIESDGLLDEITVVKCINLIDTETMSEERYTDYEHYFDVLGVELNGRDGASHEPTPRTGTIWDGLERLRTATCIGGHNVIGYDVPAIKIVYPDWTTNAQIRDSKVEAAVIFADVKERDFAAIKVRKLPEQFQQKGLIGKHSLMAWSTRIGGEVKDDFDPKTYGHTWKTMPFTVEFDEYCMQDVRANVDVFRRMDKEQYPASCLDLEHAVATIIQRQEQHGWLFDLEAAHALVAKLQIERVRLTEACAKLFAPWYVSKGGMMPKVNNSVMGYTKGAPLTKVELQVFNPGSRAQIADRLTKVRGWVPTEYGANGIPTVDEDILASLPYPEAKIFTEYLTIEKRLGQLAEGKEAILKRVGPDGRVHGRVNTNGTVTGRMSHYQPNVAQTPKVGTLYGAEFRALYTVPAGKVLVGCDASGLELRMLAHYMAKYDNGEYIKAVTVGTKENGDDPHTLTQRAVKLNSRDSAKTFVYALLYGAGDWKLGSIIVDDMSDEQRAKFNAANVGAKAQQAAYTSLGKRAKANLAKGLPALALLIADVKKIAARGWLRGLDGRRIPVRSSHAALNTLLQSAGAVVMKKALVLLDTAVTRIGLVPGEHFEFVGNIHDEFQMEVDAEVAEVVGEFAAESIRIAGEAYGLRCPLAGEFAVGRNWCETH